MRDTLVCPVETCSRHRHPFSSKNNLQQHIHSLHSNKPYSCDKCTRSFGLRYRCVAHKIECGFKFKCCQCNKTFPSSQALELHCRRSRHITKSAKEQLMESRWIQPEVYYKKKRDRKKESVLKIGEERKIVISNPLISLLNTNKDGIKKIRTIKMKKYYNEASTQTVEDHYPPYSVPYTTIYPPYIPPSPLLQADTQTQTLVTVSQTESVQTNLMLTHSPSTEHAEVQTLLSHECWSPEWSLFPHTHSDNLFDFGTQTYDGLLGRELGLIDSSVQTYF
ncbi:ATM interactor [Oopsacas minuta]|uniref:ATM interactor n=1 Tax=Oopsacas minuta TaxID=111878 RepID=A0AAV7JJC2_9METZ|nr:ATM interactor [Oopsacas minuta]